MNSKAQTERETKRDARRKPAEIMSILGVTFSVNTESFRADLLDVAVSACEIDWLKWIL